MREPERAAAFKGHADFRPSLLPCAAFVEWAFAPARASNFRRQAGSRQRQAGTVSWTAS